jgi:hypothetical protein
MMRRFIDSWQNVPKICPIIHDPDSVIGLNNYLYLRLSEFGVQE